MGSHRELVSASGRLCSLGAPFRGKPHPRLDAGCATGQLDRRFRASRPRVRCLLIPRQYRRGTHRRDRCKACVQGPRPHRLPRGDCRRCQRRRRRQRHRRHHDDDDVDRGRQPPFRASCLCRGYGCAVRLGHPGIACPTEIRADRQRSADRSAHFVSDTLPWSSSCSPRRSPPMSGRICSTPIYSTNCP